MFMADTFWKGVKACKLPTVYSRQGGLMSTVNKQFTAHLCDEIVANVRNWHTDNWPADEKGPEPEVHLYPAVRQLGAKLRHNPLTSSVARLYRTYFRPLARDAALLLAPAMVYKRHTRRFADISYLYDLLDNEDSRTLLVKLMAYRIMGHKKVKLPRNTPEHNAFINKMAALPTEGGPIKVNFMDLSLELRDLSSIGFNARAYCTPGGGSYVFLQRQYEYHSNDISCKAEPGDVVIDAGACWGETSLYFAHEASRVVAFEFIPSNIEVFEKNLEANPHLSGKIDFVNRPIWSTSGQDLYYVDWGPGSRVSFQKMREDFPDTKTVTTTIDDTVRELGLPKVDFIKMDIEGAELNALKGAEHCIRAYHPKLAISLYHSLDDFSTIPRYLASLGLEYKYYLAHHTIYENETVLFAIPRETAEHATSDRVS